MHIEGGGILLLNIEINTFQRDGIIYNLYDNERFRNLREDGYAYPIFHRIRRYIP